MALNVVPIINVLVKTKEIKNGIIILFCEILGIDQNMDLTFKQNMYMKVIIVYKWIYYIIKRI